MKKWICATCHPDDPNANVPECFRCVVRVEVDTWTVPGETRPLIEPKTVTKD